jgi:L-alanine-DL-glutamate epimerase-like enolase superfamily enzyme
MKITKIEAIPIEIPFKKPHELRYVTMYVCDHVITRVYTDQDIVGIGEVSNIHIITEETQGSAVHAIRKILAPALEGQDVHNFAMITKKMDAALHGNPMAKASIDMACYDIVGKKLGLPVYTLLGGEYREKIELTMSIGVQSADQMAKEAISLAEQGFGIKLKFGLDPSAREDVERARIVREAVGPEAKIWGDANGGYTSVARCIQALKQMEQYNLYLLEQPAARYDYDSMIELRRQLSTPVGADESVFSPEDAWNVVKKRIADVINVKVTETGGFFIVK